MLKFIKKDVTTIETGIVAHGCNCRGVMGSGVAVAIKNKWYKAYTDNVVLCNQYKQSPGDMLGMTQVVGITDKLFVANCFTQETYGRENKAYADLNALIESIENAVAFAETNNLPLYMPRIGCGLGGLDWDTQVGPAIDIIAMETNIDIYVCDLI